MLIAAPSAGESVSGFWENHRDGSRDDFRCSVLITGRLVTPGLVPTLWIAAGAGWGVIAAGLWRGLSGQTRRAAMLAHVLTPGGIVLRSSLVGYGLLPALITVTAGWWALAAVTGLRPERIIDPADAGAAVRLAAWFALGAVVVVVIYRLLP